MESLLYVRLIGYTAGTLVQLFWMVVILGYRRQRNFERVFFFLCLALFFFYGGSLLALNSQIYYPQPPETLADFATAVISVGLCLVPALLLHLHLEYAQTRALLRYKEWKRAVLLVFYVLGVHLAFHRIPLLIEPGHFDYVVPGRSLGPGFAMTLAVSLGWCAGWEKRFANKAPDRPQRVYHWVLFFFFVASFLAVAGLHLELLAPPAPTTETLAMIFVLLPILPFTILIYLVQHHNFLQIGRQKNLVFAVAVTFLALLYLSLVRRLSEWLAPVLPPEASASILLFLLVLIIEPLQRFLGRRLQETAQREMDRVQQLTMEIQQEARQGDLRSLVRFIERRVREQLEFEEVRLTMLQPDLGLGFPKTGGSEAEESYSVYTPGRLNAVLIVKPHGAMLSGEARAALESLSGQLPSAIELCRLIEEKLQLERELAERERLALVGQTAASISHNLKNPLGSIKTILQVQLENPEMPESMKGETKIVLDEIARLSATLNQLLQFSRPAVRVSGEDASCDAARVVEEVTVLLRHEAERRGIALTANTGAAASMVAASAEAINDIVSNLLVNALEAAPRNGHVWVTAQSTNDACEIRVADDGPGIPEAVRAKIVQPFFTTKARGTGLGLAIVARRAAEFGGKLDWDSPGKTEAGAIFVVTLPLQKSN